MDSSSNLKKSQIQNTGLSKLWFIISRFFEMFRSEPTLISPSGKSSNETCNPIEYNALGQKMSRTKEELALIYEFNDAVVECLEGTMEMRKNLNESRKKFDINIRETNVYAQNYSVNDIKELMDSYSRLDENDDLLIDREEFLLVLKHFNPDTNTLADSDIFTIADKSGDNVICFEEFVELCAIVDGYCKVPDANKQAVEV